MGKQKPTTFMKNLLGSPFPTRNRIRFSFRQSQTESGEAIKYKQNPNLILEKDRNYVSCLGQKTQTELSNTELADKFV